jgi:hypothetical protein
VRGLLGACGPLFRQARFYLVDDRDKLLGLVTKALLRFRDTQDLRGGFPRFV